MSESKAPPPSPGHDSPLLAKANQLMVICNACRYCEGLCAVFPAMERRRIFTGGDLDQLANLCHNCGACLYGCQYAPPHQFDVGIPSTFAALRQEAWQRYAWPRFMARSFQRNSIATFGAIAASVVIFVLVVAMRLGDDLTTARSGEGSFYEVLPHDAMVGVFLAGFAIGVLALGVSLYRFWRSVAGGRPSLGDLAGAARSANTLEYLDGGGVGCMNDDEHPTDTRRRYHHLTYYGFISCLGATTLAAILESGFHQPAPYPLWHPVVILGVIGGSGLLIGPAGLLIAKLRRDPELNDTHSRPMELAFLTMLALLSITGFGVLVFRETAAMPLLLAVHLGVVFAFFATIPYSKFVHGFYRYVSLVNDQRERRLGELHKLHVASPTLGSSRQQ